MRLYKSNKDFLIKVANADDLFDLKLCAQGFLEFIDDFQIKFLKNKLFILTAYYDNILAGILVSEQQIHKIDSIENLIPTIYLHLIYVNPKYRRKYIGTTLLKSFILIQKKKGIASICIKLPQKYQNGIKFFQNYEFRLVGLTKNEVILEHNLWDDYGISDCQLIGDDFNITF
ncbi:MAG: GNAT family N-acetyltransferase [Promethearchaeota archaeon]